MKEIISIYVTNIKLSSWLCLVVLILLVLVNSVNIKAQSNDGTEIVRDQQLQINYDICSGNGLCLTKWRVVPGGDHYMAYTDQRLFVFGLEGTLAQYDLQNAFPVMSQGFDYEPISATEVLMSDSASSQLYIYDLVQSEISPFISMSATSCTYLIERPSRYFMRPLGSEQLLVCSTEGNERLITIVDIVSRDITIIDRFSFPILQQNIQPWESVILSKDGAVYTTFSDFSGRNFLADTSGSSVIASYWNTNLNRWMNIETPESQLQSPLGQLAGVDDLGRAYFYQVGIGIAGSDTLTVVNTDGTIITTLTENDLGIGHQLLGIYSDGRVAVATPLQNGDISMWQIEDITISIDDLKPLSLASLCSPDPDTIRVWRVHNTNTNPVDFTWDVVGTDQAGSGIVPAGTLENPAEVFLETQTVTDSPNTTRIFVNDERQDIQDSIIDTCMPQLSSPILNLISDTVDTTPIFSTLQAEAQNNIDFEDLIYEFQYTIDVHWNPDGTSRYAVASTPSTDIYIVDNNLNVLGQFDPNTVSDVPDIRFGPLKVSWSPNGEKLAIIYSSAGNDFLQIWDISSDIVDTYEFGNDRIIALKNIIAWNSIGTQIAVIEEQRVVVIDITTNNIINEIFVDGIPFADDIKWNSDDNQLVVLSSQGLVTIWDMLTGEKNFELGTENVSQTVASIIEQGQTLYDAVAWQPNGDLLVLYDAIHSKIEVWNPTQSIMVNEFFIPKGSIKMMWESQGLITYRQNGDIEIWDITTGSLLDDIQFDNNERIAYVEWNPIQQEIFYSLSKPNASFQDIIQSTPIDSCITPNCLNPPTLSAISDTTNTTPTFTWSAVSGTESYLLSVSSTSTSAQESFVAADICNSTECLGTLSQPLTPDTYTASVQGVNATATSEWSNVITFDVLQDCDFTVPAGDTAGLISAINSANGDPDATSICLEDGTYSFTTSNNSANGNNALPIISTDITIMGNGAVLSVSGDVREWFDTMTLIDLIFDESD